MLRRSGGASRRARIATQSTKRDHHWTANSAVVAVVLATAIFLPIIGLLISVPCLAAARRAGVAAGPYVLAVALNVGIIVVMVAATLIQPG